MERSEMKAMIGRLVAKGAKGNEVIARIQDECYEAYGYQPGSAEILPLYREAKALQGL